ncbi:MAG: cytidylate kinase family protein [Clostridiales bacterium]|nr:cytidylate kinase family protein [Clostridiales bacterium]
MHISITGRLGSGKSTVAKIIAEKYGYEIVSTGTALRNIAASLGMTALEFNRLMTSDPKYDYMIDRETRRISVERAGEKIIYDSRMAWNFAVNSFKVYLYVNTEVSAKRILGDGTRGSVESYRDIGDAIAQINERMNEENRRYSMIYGVDNLDLRNYDCVIDTEFRSCEEVAELIMSEFASFSADPEGYRRFFLR